MNQLILNIKYRKIYQQCVDNKFIYENNKK